MVKSATQAPVLRQLISQGVLPDATPGDNPAVYRRYIEQAEDRHPELRTQLELARKEVTKGALPALISEWDAANPGVLKSIEDNMTVASYNASDTPLRNSFSYAVNGVGMPTRGPNVSVGLFGWLMAGIAIVNTGVDLYRARKVDLALGDKRFSNTTRSFGGAVGSLVGGAIGCSLGLPGSVIGGVVGGWAGRSLSQVYLRSTAREKVPSAAQPA